MKQGATANYNNGQEGCNISVSQGSENLNTQGGISVTNFWGAGSSCVNQSQPLQNYQTSQGSSGLEIEARWNGYEIFSTSFSPIKVVITICFLCVAGYLLIKSVFRGLKIKRLALKANWLWPLEVEWEPKNKS